MTKNALLAAGYGGSQYFPPVCIFSPETANSVMALLLVHDLANTTALSHPSTPLANPLHMFADQCVSGGIWRCPYRLRSVSEVAAILYYANRSTKPLGVAVLATLAYNSLRSNL